MIDAVVKLAKDISEATANLQSLENRSSPDFDVAAANEAWDRVIDLRLELGRVRACQTASTA